MNTKLFLQSTIALLLAILFLFITGRLSIVLRGLGYNPSFLIAFLIMAGVGVGLYFVWQTFSNNRSKNGKASWLTQSIQFVPVMLLIFGALAALFYLLFWTGVIHLK